MKKFFKYIDISTVVLIKFDASGRLIASSTLEHQRISVVGEDIILPKNNKILFYYR